ncbi:uncharacterized protein LOC132622257 [Lycium barbarum]|uniref:uncharacterized protein LOC132622257 n=1 Tax=Lycium barbarum TaxID=112863 RepID=UPI00293E1052|nr:uncharacterized protein LOC132622257 [Lycium barbarum]
MEANAGLISEFDPSSEWHKEEFDVLIVHIPEFTNKQGLKVQISNLGVVKISGDRQVGNSRIRFYKEFPIPKDCNTDEIQARLAKGFLKISFPKKVTAPHEEDKTSNKSRISKKITNMSVAAMVIAVVSAITSFTYYVYRSATVEESF